jgi:hypothetical protein
MNASGTNGGFSYLSASASALQRFGAFINQSLVQASRDYFGDESCFVFQLSPVLLIYADHANDTYVRAGTDALSVGGPE